MDALSATPSGIDKIPFHRIDISKETKIKYYISGLIFHFINNILGS